MITVLGSRSGARAGWRRVVAVVIGSALGLLSACGGSDDGTTTPTTATPGPVARLEVSPTSVLLTSAGEKRALSVKAFDANGVEVPNPPLSFSSSRPEQVTVAADGTLGAVVGAGSALIGVASGTVTATPLLAAVAQPADGVLLVGDAQVASAPQALAPDPNAAPGTPPQLQVRLSGVGLPAAGSLMVGTGGQPVAGRVVSATAAGDKTDVVLETVPLPVLFKSASIDVSYTAEQTAPWFQPAAAQQGQQAGRKHAAGLLDTVECSGDIRRDLLAIDQKLKVTPSMSVDLKYHLDNSTLQDFHVSAKGKVETSGKMTVQVMPAALTGSVTCKALLGAIIIPVTGPLSIALAPVVPIHAKFVVTGQWGFTAVSIGADLVNSASLAMALDYTRDGGLVPNFDGSLDAQVKFDAHFDESGAARLKLTGFLGLSSGVALGNVLARLDVIEADAGPQLEARFGGEYDVSQDAGYQAGYDAKLKLSIGPGKGIKDAIKAIIGTEFVTISTGFSTDKVLASTAKAQSITIDRNTFAKGDNVAFQVQLDPSTVNFPFVGYNVKEVRIYRLIRDFSPLPTAVLVASAPAAADQTKFDLSWLADVAGTATEAGSGKAMFYAFVVDSALSTVSQFFPFELGDVTGKSKPALFRLAGTGASIFAIGADGQLRSMGSNDGGSLGAGLPVGQAVDAPVAVLGSTDAVSVTGSAWFGAMLKKDGSVWAWGWGPAIGSTSRDNPQPVLAVEASASDRNLSISSGYRSTAVVKSSGRVLRFGDTVSHPAVAAQPGAMAAAEGLSHTLILTTDGKVYGWGDNSSGQIGTALLAGSYSSSVQVPGLSGIVAIAAGNTFSLALKDDGTVWAWGDNTFGQLGLGLAPGIVATPVAITTLGNIKKISAGEYHAMALAADGAVYSWGSGDACRLGAGDPATHREPTQVFSGASDIDAGEFSSLFLRDGAVWRAGRARGFNGDACLPTLTPMPGSAP